LVAVVPIPIGVGTRNLGKFSQEYEKATTDEEQKYQLSMNWSSLDSAGGVRGGGG
jgi:hypothetical protein